MIIKDFIDKIDGEFALTTELRDKLFREIIPTGIGEILDVVNYIERVFTFDMVGASQVNLPYDFAYPLRMTITDIEYTRVDLKDLQEGEFYSIALNQIDLFSYNTALSINNVENANIDILRSREVEGYYFRLSDETDNEFGIIYDNTNIYYPTNVFNSIRNLKIEAIADNDIVRFNDNDVLTIKTEYSVLDIKLQSGTNTYWVAGDGSTYTDNTFTTLITRANPNHRNFQLRLNDAVTGELKLYYKMTKPNYVNVNENEEILDLFEKQIRLYCLKELNLHARKTQTHLTYKNEYRESMAVLSQKKGKATENKIRRRIASDFKPHRLPFQGTGSGSFRLG